MILDYLDVTVGIKLKFSKHIKELVKLSICCVISADCSKISLLSPFKTVTRNQLDYSYIIYDQVHNSSFHEELESIQHDFV